MLPTEHQQLHSFPTRRSSDLENPVKGPDPRKQARRRLKKHHRKVSQDFLPRKRKYHQQFETFDGRNSYSKTDRKSTRLNSSHVASSYAVFCMKEKNRKSGLVN